MKINRLSASSFATYTACAWKYYLNYELGFQETGPKSAALAGTIAHGVFQTLSTASIVNKYPESKVWNLDYLWKICYDHYCKLDPVSAAEIDNTKLKKICKGMHDLINGPYSPKTNRTIGVEIPFDIEIKEPGFELPQSLTDNQKVPVGEQVHKYYGIRGRIDRIDKIGDGAIEIIDYKSGGDLCWSSKDRHKKTAHDLFSSDDQQARMYHLAAKTLYPDAKSVLVTFLYFVPNNFITVPFCDADLEDTKKTLLRRFKTIQAATNPARTISWQCRTLCGHGKSGLCDRVFQEFAELGAGFVGQKYSILNERKKH